MFSVNILISMAVQVLIGWIVLDKVPSWLNLRGIISTIIKIFGILIIISALLQLVKI